jgi:dienelactone hydrolase
MMGWFADKAFASPADRNDPRIALVDANLKGLAPVTLINARIDPLRSDADLLAAALKKAGVKTEHKVYDGVTHEFFGMAAVVAESEAGPGLRRQQLRKAFASTGGPWIAARTSAQRAASAARTAPRVRAVRTAAGSPNDRGHGNIRARSDRARFPTPGTDP